MPTPHVFRWDLDKTYLATPFESFRGLVRTFFESAEKKQTYPGAAPVLRALGRRSSHRLHILSGSPTQMAGVLASKLALDGIEPDGWTLKPSLDYLLRGRFRALREQLGYKLPALLAARATAPPGSGETLVGDDVELDPLVYSLYADLLSGRVGADLLVRLLEEAGVPSEIRERAPADLERRAPGPGVERILIHLERRTPPARLAVYGPRLVPFYDYFQAALILFEAGRLGPIAVAEAAAEVEGARPGSLTASVEDLIGRGGVDPSVVGRWLSSWPVADDPVVVALGAVRASPPPPTDQPTGPPDYAALYRAHRDAQASEEPRAT